MVLLSITRHVFVFGIRFEFGISSCDSSFFIFNKSAYSSFIASWCILTSKYSRRKWACCSGRLIITDNSLAMRKKVVTKLSWNKLKTNFLNLEINMDSKQRLLFLVFYKFRFTSVGLWLSEIFVIHQIFLLKWSLNHFFGALTSFKSTLIFYSPWYHQSSLIWPSK